MPVLHSKFPSQCSKWKISRNGTLVKILEHSEEKIMFSSYNQSRRNGTLIPLHLTNRNGVPVRSGPFRALLPPHVSHPFWNLSIIHVIHGYAMLCFQVQRTPIIHAWEICSNSHKPEVWQSCFLGRWT